MNSLKPLLLDNGTCGVILNPESPAELHRVCGQPPDGEHHDISTCVYRDEIRSDQRASHVDPQAMWCVNGHHLFGDQR